MPKRKRLDAGVIVSYLDDLELLPVRARSSV